MANADMRVAEVRQFCELDDAGQQLVRAAMTQLQLSARACDRCLFAQQHHDSRIIPRPSAMI